MGLLCVGFHDLADRPWRQGLDDDLEEYRFHDFCSLSEVQVDDSVNVQQ